MKIQNTDKNILNYNDKSSARKSDHNVDFIKEKTEVVNIYSFKKNMLFSTCIDDEKGEKYGFIGSYAEDYTKENPKIKIEYIPNDKNKERIVKYIDPRQVDFRNATVDEYYAAVYYLNNGEDNISGLEKPGTTGIYYNNKDRYDFVSLLERDIQMYQANSVSHHVLRYQKILNNLNNLMSTDYYKNNVDTGKHGIGVEEALTISRKQHGIFDSSKSSKKINKAMDMLDKYLEENKKRQVKERKENLKRAKAKEKQDKEELDELFKNLQASRKLTKEIIFERQMDREDKIARLKKKNMLKNNPYNLR